jgi:hypothetical protein
MISVTEMGSDSTMICIQISMKFNAGVQAIIRFDLRNLRGCNIGITDGMTL